MSTSRPWGVSPTYQEIAEDWELWCDYVDPSGIDSREEWEQRTVAQRIATIVDCFGPEPEPEPEPEEA